MASIKLASVDASVIADLKKFQGEINRESKNASAAHTMRNQFLVSLYAATTAELLRLPMTKTGKPSSAARDAMHAAFKEADIKGTIGKSGVYESGTGKRYWDTASAVVQKLVKDKAVPSQATAEAIEDFFGSQNLDSQNKLSEWAGLTRSNFSVAEKCANLVTGTPNAKTGKRNGTAKMTMDEVRKLANECKIAIDRAVREVELTDEAFKVAQAEDKKFSDVMKTMMGEN